MALAPGGGCYHKRSVQSVGQTDQRLAERRSIQGTGQERTGYRAFFPLSALKRPRKIHK